MRIFKINKDTEVYKIKTTWIENKNKRTILFENFIKENFIDGTIGKDIFASTDYSVIFVTKSFAEHCGKTKFYKKASAYLKEHGELFLLKTSSTIHKKYLKIIQNHKECFTTPKFCFINYDLPYDAPCSTSYNPVNKNLYLLIDSQIFKAGYELLRDSVEVAEEEYNKDMNI